MTRVLTAMCVSILILEVRGQIPPVTDIQEGAKIWEGYFTFENDCKLCHGDHGEGGFAKALAGHQLTPAQFLQTVRQGAAKSMPAFVPDKNLTDQQVSQIAAYLASLPKPPAGSQPLVRTPVPSLATARQ